MVVVNGRNKYYIYGDVTVIELKHGKTVSIDTEDIPLVWPYSWYPRKSRSTFYAVSGTLQWKTGKKLIMHRVILNPPDDLVVDHKDTNGLNNSKCNLRLCSENQNRRNRLPSKNKGYKGIRQNKRNGRWRAEISVNGKNKHLGMFANKKDALEAYNEAAKKYYGEFAHLNKIS